MSTLLHDPRAGLTETERKAAKATIDRRRRLNGTEAQERVQRAAHSIVCIDKMVVAMKVEASPQPVPNETWEERQERLNPLPVEKPDWFTVEAVVEPEARRPRIEDIQRAVATRYNVTRADLMCARRTANIVRPRQIAMYLAKTLTPKSYPEIGRRFGNRDHTTILHAFRKITALVETDAAVAEDVSRLSTLIQGTN